MPKLKQSRTDIVESVIRKAIAGSAAYYGFNSDELARRIGISRATWYRRMQCPSTFTISELFKMVRVLRWDESLFNELFRIGGKSS